jgi:hypothetical protein
MRPNGLMSEYIKEKLKTRIKCSLYFALQIGESTCCKISSATFIHQILIRNISAGRRHDLSTAFREIERKRQGTTVSQQKIFPGQTASVSVQAEQQIWQDTRQTSNLEYGKLLSTRT